MGIVPLEFLYGARESHILRHIEHPEHDVRTPRRTSEVPQLRSPCGADSSRRSDCELPIHHGIAFVFGAVHFDEPARVRDALVTDRYRRGMRKAKRVIDRHTILESVFIGPFKVLREPCLLAQISDPRDRIWYDRPRFPRCCIDDQCSVFPVSVRITHLGCP